MPSSAAFLVLCGLAGAFHAIAPDHWVPGSILSWQRAWSVRRVLAFCGFSYALHVALGALLYFVSFGVLEHLSPPQVFGFSVFLVAVVALLRGLRFSRLREVLRNGKNGVWGFFSALSLLGPSESLVPVLVKAHHLGAGYLTPVLAYFAGTFLAGAFLVLWGRKAWNRPLWLIRGMEWAQKRVAVVPVVAGLGIGLTFLIRIA